MTAMPVFCLAHVQIELAEEEKRTAAEKAANARLRNMEMIKHNEAIKASRELAKIEEARQQEEQDVRSDSMLWAASLK